MADAKCANESQFVQVFHANHPAKKCKSKENVNFFQHARENCSNSAILNDTLPSGSTILNSLSRIDNALLYCLN